MDLFERAKLEKRLNPILNYLHMEFQGYPYDEHKDPQYFLRLLEDFCDLNVFEERISGVIVCNTIT